MKTDEEIIKLICAGDISLFEEIVRRYESRIFSSALRATNNNEQDTLDLTQEIFLKLYNNINKFNYMSSFSTWFYRLAMNTIFDWSRKKQSNSEKIKSLQQEFIAMGIISNPKKSEQENVNKIIIEDLLTKLPRDYEQTLRYYYYDEQSYKQISQKMDVSVKTVESRIYRAKKMLKKHLIGDGKENFL